MKNVQEKHFWMYPKSNNLGEHAVLLLTCPVLLPRAPGDFLLQGLHAKRAMNKKKASHATLRSTCAYSTVYGNNSDPSFLSFNLQPQESKHSLRNHQTEEQHAIKWPLFATKFDE